MTNGRTFIGIDSTKPSGKEFDEDLVVVDLLNHLKTRKGERVMDPQYGTIVWDLIFEHQSDFVRNEIERDIVRIIEGDPRIRLQQIEIIDIEHGYIADILLNFVDFGTVRPLRFNFDRKLQEQINS